MLVITVINFYVFPLWMSVEKNLFYQQFIDSLFFIFICKCISIAGLSTYPHYYCYYDFKGTYMI